MRTTGFKARIHSEPSVLGNLSAEACSITSPCPENKGHCQSDDECNGDLICGESGNCPLESGLHPKTRCCYDYCSKWLDTRDGFITSPWYPERYPWDFKCNTLITVGMTVAGPRTITLEFMKFKVSVFSEIFACLHFQNSESSSPKLK